MYDKDFDDINMDNMGEGRPPYDLPELSGPAPQPGKDDQEFLDGLDIGQNVPDPSVANGLAQNYDDGTVVSDEIFEDSTQFVEDDASALQEDVPDDESVQPEKPKSNSSTAIIVVVLAIITIVGALGFIYSNEISLMVSKAMVAFQNGEDTTSQEQNESNDLIANDNGDSADETEEMTEEIDITRKNPNVLDVEQMANSSGMNNQEIQLSFQYDLLFLNCYT